MGEGKIIIMKHQLFVMDLLLLLLRASFGASARTSTIPAASTFTFGNGSAAHGHGAGSRVRRKRYISQDDMLAILDYHNKVRGKVFPPAANMEYMVIITMLWCFVFFTLCVFFFFLKQKMEVLRVTVWLMVGWLWQTTKEVKFEGGWWWWAAGLF